MKYRVFTNDAGENLYSGFCEIDAQDENEAHHKAERETKGLSNLNGRRVKVVACPIDDIDSVFVSTPNGLKLRK